MCHDAFGTLIGEAPANSPNGYGNIATFKLPNSKILMQISTMKFKRADSSNKDELVEPDFANIEQKRPVTDEQFAGIENEILGMFQKINTDFDKHLKDGAAGYTFEELISDAFDLLSKYAVGCLFIERNALDFPNLTQHYKECRRKFLGTMEQYLKSFIEKGMVRPIEQLDLSVTLIIEILSWWAMDRKYTSFELCNVSDELAKQVCMDNIITAYKQE